MNIAYTPHSGTANALLTGVAQKLQLPPGKYLEAQKRYDTMCEWITREGSPLRGHVARVYGQGSVSIGAVVNSKFDKDEFDVDAIVELNFRQDAAPGAVLDLLHKAIAGDPGSRYHDKTTRHTRCITVEYDEMHIDFTPAVLVPNVLARTSVIFHANEQEPAHKHYHKLANPWGFADWFSSQTPAVLAFDEELRKALNEPLPDHETLTEKSLPLVALQLIKRWRNKVYDGRAGRMPPSVMLAYYVGTAAGTRRRTLLEELSYQVAHIQSVFGAATANGRLVHVANPRCDQDVLTDRWPENIKQQEVFLADLAELTKELTTLRGDPTIAECQRIMGKLFGESATTAVIKDFSERYADRAADGRLHHQLGTGAIALAESGLASSSYASTSATLTPRHRNFGSEPE